MIKRIGLTLLVASSLALAGSNYNGSAIQYGDVVTAGAKTRDTVLLEGTNKLWEFTALAEYDNLTGFVKITTDSAVGGSFADTANDSAVVIIKTAWSSDYTHTQTVYTSQIHSGTAIVFDLTDSTVGDRIYFELIHVRADTITANAGDSIYRTAYIGLRAR